MRALRALSVLLLFAAPQALHADAAKAKALFEQGLVLERAKDFKGAIAKYQAALAAEPRYAWAHRQIGTCQYQLGDKAAALRSYDAYLAVVKNDARTQAFADRLRQELGPSPSAPAAAGADGDLRKWRLAPTLGFHTLSFKDWNESVTPANPVSGSTYPTVSSGLSVGLGLGYALSQALELGLDLDYFLVGAQSKSSGTGSETTIDYNFNLLWLGPQARYTFARAAGGKLAWSAGLGLGYGMLMSGYEGKSTSPGSGSTFKGTLSGGGLGFKLGAGAQWAFSPGFSLGLDLGYRILSVAKVDVSGSSTSGGTTTTMDYTLKKAGNADMPLDYSGLDSKLGFHLRF